MDASRSEPQTSPRRTDAFLEGGRRVLVVVLSTVLPRVAELGGLPATDEGSYAFMAQLMHHSISAGAGLPNAGTLMLYPFLVEWVFGFSVNHFVILRAVDGLVAALAAWLLVGLMERETKSSDVAHPLAFVTLFAMNLSPFVQSGFKNSMFAALVPLLAALRLALRGAANGPSAWIAAGALAGLGVLLRESFVPFLLLGALALALSSGRRAALRFSLGAAGCGLAVVLAASAARGSLGGLIEAYRETATVLGTARNGPEEIAASASVFVREAWVPLALALAAGAAWAPRRASRTSVASPGRILLFAAFALAPLIEPLSKVGFPYHYAASLPGLGLLTATLLQGSIAKERHVTVAALAVGVALLAPGVSAHLRAWPTTVSTLREVSNGAWPDALVPQTNYLIAARTIRAVAPTATTLSVSGFMYPLYGLTGLLPPSARLADLTATLILMGSDEAALSRALRACPPEVLMTTTRDGWPGAAGIVRAVLASGAFEKVATVPVGDRAYGTFGGDVYRRLPSAARPCEDHASWSLPPELIDRANGGDAQRR